MIHQKLPGLMTPIEKIVRVANSASAMAESEKTSPSGSISVTNSDGSRTVLGAVNGMDASGMGVSVATHVGDTTAPGRPVGVTAASSAGVIVAFWSGSLDGGTPDDFDHVTLMATSSDGLQKVVLGKLSREGSVTSAALASGTTWAITATAEDDAHAEDGTPAHNVSTASDAVSVTVTAAADQASVDAAAAAAKAAQDTATAAKSTADSAASAATSAQATATAAQSAAESAKTYVCSCSTDGATAAKVAGADGFSLAAGSQVAVTFANANTAASPTLNVNGTGAKSIRLNGAGYAYWAAGATVALVYDGAYWQVCNTPLYGSTATIGNPGGANVYVDSDSVDIRKGTSTLATFGADSRFSFMRTTGNTFITTTSGNQIAFGQYDKSTGDVDDVFFGLLNNSTSGHSAPIIGMRAPYIMVQTSVFSMDRLRDALKQPRLYIGTKVIRMEGSVGTLFSAAEMTSLFGDTSGAPHVYVLNGDWNATNCPLTTLWNGHAVYVQYANGASDSNPIRVNYLVVVAV